MENKVLTIGWFLFFGALLYAGSGKAGYSYEQIIDICSKYEDMRDRRNCIGHYLADNDGKHYKPE